MNEPIRQSPLLQQVQGAMALQVQGLSLDSECVVWKGPIGTFDKNGVPSAWSPGFVLDPERGLEAYVMPKTIVIDRGLTNSTGFWGAEPVDPNAKVVTATRPVESASTITEEDPQDTGDGVSKAKGTNSVVSKRLEFINLIEQYATRVRIVGLDPETVTYPKAEEWEVLTFGMFPANTRFGLLVPTPDPTGRRWTTGTGTVSPSEHQAKVDALTTAPAKTSSPAQAAIEATKASADLADVKAGDRTQAGGFPAEGETHRRGTMNVERVVVADPSTPDPGACDT